MEETKVYLNSWYFYNEGCIGFGWMNVEEARNFMKEHKNDTRYEEWFIADIDNYLGIEFDNLNYRSVSEVLDKIEKLENMEEDERKNVIALLEYNCSDNIDEALDCLDNHMFYDSIDSYYDLCDELIDEALDKMGNLSCYFDYERYHRDCMLDAYEASNGIVICY